MVNKIDLVNFKSTARKQHQFQPVSANDLTLFMWTLVVRLQLAASSISKLAGERLTSDPDRGDLFLGQCNRIISFFKCFSRQFSHIGIHGNHLELCLNSFILNLLPKLVRKL